MLSIYFGTYKGDNYINNPDLYFDNTYEDEWLNDPVSKQMVKDIDRSELVSPNLVISPVLGSIPVSRLSGGVKALIQINNDKDHVYNASACGDNCVPWLLKISEEKDVFVRLGHLMRFPNKGFRIRIVNNNEIVDTWRNLVHSVLSEKMLDE